MQANGWLVAIVFCLWLAVVGTGLRFDELEQEVDKLERTVAALEKAASGCSCIGVTTDRWLEFDFTVTDKPVEGIRVDR